MFPPMAAPMCRPRSNRVFESVARPGIGWHYVAAALLCAVLTGVSQVADAALVDAGPPTDYSVTIYRASPAQDARLDVDALHGVALISEHRSITIPAGDSIIRFPAVANGIRATTAVLSGLPAELLEMNRDARVLGPLELIQAAVGRTVMLVRTDRRSGVVTRVAATIRGGDQGSVVFETAQGVQALHCTGVAEHLTFGADTDLGATPTLSVRVRSASDVTAVATLSYLSDGFDWRANYVGMLSADEKLLDLGGWVTLGNSNAAGFPSARTQVVAGKLNRVADADAPPEPEAPVIAQCWPSGTTSDIPPPLAFAKDSGPMDRRGVREERLQDVPISISVMAFAPAPTAVMVQEEQLGDLKLYRVPETTDIASHQMKQVRLLDRFGIPVESFYRADVDATANVLGFTSPDSFSARKMLRARNDDGHHLGLPLPAGQIAVTMVHHGEALLLSELPMRDVARDEQLEIDLGDSADVQVQVGYSIVDISKAPAPAASSTIGVSNARARPVVVEIHLHLPDGTQLIDAAPAPGGTAASPIFKLSVQANASSRVWYRTRRGPDAGRG